MISSNFFTISDFAKLMGISRQTLIYYDRIGLFKPIRTLGNGYRLYSRSQINVLSLISMLSEMGVPLKKIKEFVDNISPDTAIAILKKQREEAEDKLRRLRMLESMISLRIEQITCGKAAAEKPLPQFSVTELREDIPLYVGEAINCSMEDIPDDFIIDFYAQCEKLNFPLIFASGQMKSRDTVIAGRTEIISSMCFALKGLYVVGYVRGDYGNTDAAYRELLAFTAENGLRIAGNAYEEYLLDELAESDPDNFILKIMLRVERLPDGQ